MQALESHHRGEERRSGPRKADEKFILQVRHLSIMDIQTLPYGIKMRHAMPLSKRLFPLTRLHVHLVSFEISREAMILVCYPSSSIGIS